MDIVNSIAISKNFIEDLPRLINFILDVFEMTKDKITGDEDGKYNEVINSGAYKGKKKWEREALKTTSYTPFNLDNVVRSTSESGNEASINYYIHNVSPTRQVYDLSTLYIPSLLNKLGANIEEPQWVKQSSKKKQKSSIAF